MSRQRTAFQQAEARQQTASHAAARRHAPVDPRAPVSFKLDSDLLPACEDQAQAMGMDWREWIGQACNDALRGYLGL